MGRLMALVYIYSSMHHFWNRGMMMCYECVNLVQMSSVSTNPLTFSTLLKKKKKYQIKFLELKIVVFENLFLFLKFDFELKCYVIENKHYA